MKVADLDHAHGSALSRCLQRLATLMTAPSAQWHPEQLAAAREDLRAARRLMDSDLLTVTGQAVIRRKIDRVEAQTLSAERVER